MPSLANTAMDQTKYRVSSMFAFGFIIWTLLNVFTCTLSLAYLSCKFAFRAHFHCVVRTYDLKCVENANQLVSTHGKFHKYSYVLESISALTNQNCIFRKKSILKCVDFLIGKSNLNVEICYIIVRNTILFLTSMIYLLLNPFKRLLSFL